MVVDENNKELNRSIKPCILYGHIIEIIFIKSIIMCLFFDFIQAVSDVIKIPQGRKTDKNYTSKKNVAFPYYQVTDRFAVLLWPRACCFIMWVGFVIVSPSSVPRLVPQEGCTLQLWYFLYIMKFKI